MTTYEIVDTRATDGMEVEVEGEVVAMASLSNTRTRLLVRADTDESSPPSGLSGSDDGDEDYEQVLRADLQLADYRQLQDRAKENGIKANQTADELIEAIIEAELEQ